MQIWFILATYISITQICFILATYIYKYYPNISSNIHGISPNTITHMIYPKYYPYITLILPMYYPNMNHMSIIPFW